MAARPLSSYCHCNIGNELNRLTIQTLRTKHELHQHINRRLHFIHHSRTVPESYLQPLRLHLGTMTPSSQPSVNPPITPILRSPAAPTGGRAVQGSTSTHSQLDSVVALAVSRDHRPVDPEDIPVQHDNKQSVIVVDPVPCPPTSS